MNHRQAPTVTRLARRLTLALLLVPLGACASLSGGQGPAPTGARAAGWSNIGDGTLYARDGTPVSTRSQAIPSATMPQQSPPPQRTVQPPGESRTYLLELYQVAIEDNERLALELDSLGITLNEMIATCRSLEEERRAWMIEREELVAEKQRLEGQNFELAERLTTAQIRRLEAEGMLLEAALERTRAAAAEEAAEAEEDADSTKASWASRPDSGPGR